MNSLLVSQQYMVTIALLLCILIIKPLWLALLFAHWWHGYSFASQHQANICLWWYQWNETIIPTSCTVVYTSTMYIAHDVTHYLHFFVCFVCFVHLLEVGTAVCIDLTKIQAGSRCAYHILVLRCLFFFFFCKVGASCCIYCTILMPQMLAPLPLQSYTHTLH